MTTEISGDPYAMLALAERYHAIADDLVSKTARNRQNLRNAVRHDASRGTRDGRTAPVYQPIIDELDAAGDRYLEGATALAEKIRGDADALAGLARDLLRAEEDAVRRLRTTTTTMQAYENPSDDTRRLPPGSYPAPQVDTSTVTMQAYANPADDPRTNLPAGSYPGAYGTTPLPMPDPGADREVERLGGSRPGGPADAGDAVAQRAAAAGLAGAVREARQDAAAADVASAVQTARQDAAAADVANAARAARREHG